jgi:hypothetical protein
MLSLTAAVGYGAVGGLIAEVIVVWRWLDAWRQARRTAITRRKQPPAITRFIDPGPDLAVALTRAALGAVAGLLLRGEITGMYAALTVGASAPTPTSSAQGLSCSDVVDKFGGQHEAPLGAAFEEQFGIEAKATTYVGVWSSAFEDDMFVGKRRLR